MTYRTIPLQEIKKVARKKRTNGRKRGDTTIEGVYTGAKEVKECERITRVDGDIPVRMPVENEQHFLFISHDQSVLTHGLHKYPAKFFPELPRWLIRKYSREYDIVLDPFSGSGTTNVEALLNKRHSVGIDVDPFSRYLSKVKTTPLDEGEIIESCGKLLNAVADFNLSYVDEEDIPEFPYRDKWFNKEIILELAYIKKCIEGLDVCINVKDFYKICFSSIIRSVSNADNHCTRTVIRKKLNKKVYPGDGLTQFAETVLTNVPKMIAFSRECPHDISTEFPETSDARFIRYCDSYFDLAVTSPPYANAVDYPRTHQLEMYWLGFATGSLTPLKRLHVGTESVRAHEYNSLHMIGIPEADHVISRIYRKDPRRAYIMYRYLSDMEKNLNEVHKKLKKGARYVVVVGSNKIRGETFENWVYIMKMAESVGFQIEKWFASEIIRHFIKVPREERITTDWIVVLKKV